MGSIYNMYLKYKMIFNDSASSDTVSKYLSVMYFMHFQNTVKDFLRNNVGL